MAVAVFPFICIVNGNNKKIAVPLCGKMKFKTI
jgi:hypothetical protein